MNSLYSNHKIGPFSRFMNDQFWIVHSRTSFFYLVKERPFFQQYDDV